MSQTLCEHYRLRLQPFGVTPDLRFLYPSATYLEAMATLIHGIQSARGFTALIAGPGMGKTTLLFNLLQILKGKAQTAFLFQSLCGVGPGEFLSAVLADLGIEDDGSNVMQMHRKLNEYLIRESLRGQQVVVIIDEAQNLDAEVLELVRMLSNFETPSKKLLHVILAGQPQLVEMVNSPRLAQLRQRISTVARLSPLSVRETCEYIEHQLRQAGQAAGKPCFTNQACAMIARESEGVPRNINNLCFNGMCLGWTLKRPIVDELMIQDVVHDQDLMGLTAAPAKCGERWGHPARFSGDMCASGELRHEVLFTIAVLASLAERKLARFESAV